MFDDFGFVTLVIAIVAFIFARKARNEVKVLRARVDAYEALYEEMATEPPLIIPAATAGWDHPTPPIASVA